MEKIPVCTHKKHPGPIRKKKYKKRCLPHNCKWLTYEDPKEQFIDSHKRF